MEESHNPPPKPVLSGPSPAPASPGWTGGAVLLRLGAALGIVICVGLALGIGFAVALKPFFVAQGLNFDVGGAALSELFAQALGLSGAGLLAMWTIVGPMEKRRLADVGLGSRGAFAGTAAGFAIGAALMAMIVGGLALAGWYRIAGPGRGTGAQFALYVVLFFFVALSEEVIARGIVFRLLEGWLGTYAGIALSALLFGLLHAGNPGSTPTATLFIAVEAGILLAAVYRLTGSLWWAVGLHWSWNLFQGPVFGVPVSGMDLPAPLRAVVTGPALWTGGRFGPEAGLVALLLATGLGLYLLHLTARRGLLVPPVWRRRREPTAAGS